MPTIYPKGARSAVGMGNAYALTAATLWRCRLALVLVVHLAAAEPQQFRSAVRRSALAV